MRSNRPTRLWLAALLAIVVFPTSAHAQSGLTFEQVERKYPRMSDVYILKCDKNGDGFFTNVEMGCVRGIYQAMYITD
jgi:hypothetical protein